MSGNRDALRKNALELLSKQLETDIVPSSKETVVRFIIRSAEEPNGTNSTLRRILIAFCLLAALLWSGAASAQERTTEDRRIHLEAAVFDPLQGPKLPAAAPRLGPGDSTDRWIVQFHAPLTREQRRMLTANYGLKLTQYIPNLAYLERVPQADLERLRQSELVRAVVAYQPAFKISPRIGKTRFRSIERRNQPGFLLRAVLFGDADPEAVAASIRGLQGVSQVQVQDFRKDGADARIEFQLASLSELPSVARLEGVRWIEEVAEQNEDNGNSAGTIQSGVPGTEPVWDKGLHGEGQIVGVIDSGPVDIDHCMFRDPADNTPSATHRKMLEVRGAGVSGHATFVAGIVAGDDFNNLGTGGNRGNAWAARLVSGRRGEGIFNALVSNRTQGARIHTNSWHDDTAGSGNPATYNQTAADTDAFLWNNQEHLVLGSMGNNGEEQGPPGTAKNAIGVNASRRDPNEMNVGDGNPGPTADGRRKPDIVTPGCLIASAIQSTPCNIQLSNACATSWATPAAAAAAALIRQYYSEGWYPTGTALPQNAKNPTGALLKATLLNATIDMTGVAGYPSNNEGWGMARLNNTLFFPGIARRLRAWDVPHADGLATGEFQAFTIDVGSSTEPLKVTLAWFDAPGTSGAANPVVNNLNLTVIAPNSTIFQGNVFAGGQSASGGTPDAINNVEQVLISTPAIGTWTIRVGAPVVNVGLPGQGFAVVATARMLVPAIQVPGGVGLVATCLGSTTLATLNVCNTGQADLIVSSIASSDAQFSVQTPSAGYPVTVGSNGCFPFNVAFSSTAEGPQAATLSIASNDPETPTVAVSATATGTQKDIRVTGSTAFGVVSAWTPGERTVAVCNTGQCPLTVSGATINCPDFSLITSPLPATLSSSACVDLTIGFTPTLQGPKSCQLEIASNDPDTPTVSRTLTARTPPFLSLHAGLAVPHGALHSIAKQGSTFHLDFVYPWTPNWAWDVRLGASRFDGRAGNPDTDVSTLSANAKFTINPAAPVHVFFNGGLGLYHFQPGDFEGGGNLGAGLNVPLGPRFALELTYNYDSAFTASPSLDFSTAQLGLLVSF